SQEPESEPLRAFGPVSDQPADSGPSEEPESEPLEAVGLQSTERPELEPKSLRVVEPQSARGSKSQSESESARDSPKPRRVRKIERRPARQAEPESVEEPESRREDQAEHPFGFGTGAGWPSALPRPPSLLDPVPEPGPAPIAAAEPIDEFDVDSDLDALLSELSAASAGSDRAARPPKSSQPRRGAHDHMPDRPADQSDDFSALLRPPSAGEPKVSPSPPFDGFEPRRRETGTGGPPAHTVRPDAVDPMPAEKIRPPTRPTARRPRRDPGHRLPKTGPRRVVPSKPAPAGPPTDIPGPVRKRYGSSKNAPPSRKNRAEMFASETSVFPAGKTRRGDVLGRSTSDNPGWFTRSAELPHIKLEEESNRGFAALHSPRSRWARIVGLTLVFLILAAAVVIRVQPFG
ncbi:MAG: hypothetical protein ACR2QK_00305, partial [Acidimicrobiales bacterium]